MSRLQLVDVVASVQQLPALPGVVLRVLQSFEQADPDIDALSHEISQDEALATRVLRLANSSFYGMQGKVGTLHDAMTVLGFRNVRAAVAGIAVMRCFADARLPGLDIRRFWSHGSMVGLAARVIAQQTRQAEELAFTAGLVHDVGVLALLTRYPAEMVDVLSYQVSHDCLLREAERDVLGLDHAQVGHALLSHWHFPAPICDAVLGHHVPDDCGPLADVVHVADAVSHAIYASGVSALDDDDVVPPLREIAFNRLGLTVDVLRRTLSQVVRDHEQARHALLS